MTVHNSAYDLAQLAAVFRDGEEEDRLSTVQKLSQEPEDLGERRAVLALLIEVMGDDSWQVRKEAVNVVLQWPDVTLLASTLVDAMSEPDNIGRRNAVIEGVMRLGPICIDPLLTALSHKPEHRKVLVDVLGTYGDTRVIPALGQALLDEDANVRAAAMEQLASFSSEEVVPALRAALRSPDMLVALAALDGLNRQHIVLPVAEVLPLREAVALRPAMMTSLGYSKDAAAVPVLIDGLLDKARGAREAALVALYRLYQQLNDAGKKQVIESAKRLDEMAVRSSLRALLEATPPVRQATAALLGWTGRREMLRPLVLALGDADRNVGETTGQAILQMGVEAISVLCDMLPTLDPRSRASAFHFFNRHATEITDEGLRGRIRSLLGYGTQDKNAATAQAAEQALAAFPKVAQD
ncbi:MAG: HEAT repeat domain-containing protein [Polyangia bacterium]|jgi:HEAT repeat protein